MLVQKLRYRHRLYPTAGQPIALAQAFGWARVAWNDALTLSNRLHQEGRQYPGGGKLQKLCITQAKWTPERSWLADASNIPLAQSIRDLDKASRHWCSSPKGKHKGKVRAPGFKRPSNNQSIRFTRGGFWVEGRTLRLTKVGSIPVTWNRDLLAEPGSVTIAKDAAGPCFASFVVEAEGHQLQPNGKAAGIDLGLASLAVTSDGEKDRPAQVPSLRLKADAQAEPRPES